MTQRISKKTGRKYTVGSSQGYGGWEPKTCWACGDKIVRSRMGPGGLGSYFDHLAGAAYAWHGRCASGPPPNGAKEAA